jgi:hypothetical protein
MRRRREMSDGAKSFRKKGTTSRGFQGVTIVSGIGAGPAGVASAQNKYEANDE